MKRGETVGKGDERVGRVNVAEVKEKDMGRIAKKKR